MSIMRSLRQSDFKDKSCSIRATYHGNSRCLKQGEVYEVTPTNNPKLVTVQLTHNPQLRMSNGGVRFTMSTFLVEEEERPMALSFKDLAPEDQEALLAEAREIVEQENIAKNARAVFAQKRKELVEKNMDEIYKDYRVMSKKHCTALHQRYINVVNLIFRVSLIGVAGMDATGVSQITTQEEWNLYEGIANATKDFFISCHTMYRRK